ncbi:NADH:ubiquinone oxidoreductase 20.1kD subunit [Pyrenophora tritici-repentis]|nr:NADH:ubiquinone oxidoreductase 20.1kD subunit [Pyrenophora tritici-repentis Pt-1C-BFP]KAI1553170.1 NADH:ubiquinone oxidoreductase 20.1kD subunit [Pyrenophora tritici-repentis]EDU47703.1 NADH:ubiquinone oxidoreductase 20.1kD subunit [Pyrenophora tritici-repentis Pt-1C-BFP]KAI1578653.1 NADH:ubiquinone oxidoreductase 20.1kD subunit [Pyrenophora tritici-repentis]KAI1603307.1 NADH:ubiquinone oxidoreductase 20.1kD subunit [Pyrenophora tritici-repentis]KAI1668382.1 nadh ubiquinone oxidoreductase p
MNVAVQDPRQMLRPGVKLIRRKTHFSAKPYWGAATELITNDTRYRNSTNPRIQAATMLSRRIVAARPLARTIVPARPRPQFTQIRTALTAAEKQELADPNQNGGYINPPPEKRGNRDPYGDWWDKQERRNYGEPCHEDNDILGVLSLHDYNHFTPGWGAVLLGISVATVFGLCAAVSTVYPDKISVPKTYPGGLDVELGGKGAVPARKSGETW